MLGPISGVIGTCAELTSAIARKGSRERALALARGILCWKADFLATSVHLPAGSGKLLSSRLQCADARYRL